MRELNLTVTLEEANVLLSALAEQPFGEVYTLVAKLQEQAGQQLDPAVGQKGSTVEGDAAASPSRASPRSSEASTRVPSRAPVHAA
ncbi:MAG: hypothetical protein AAF560_13800 [Acidobacteriota bacterium]